MIVEIKSKPDYNKEASTTEFSSIKLIEMLDVKQSKICQVVKVLDLFQNKGEREADFEKLVNYGEKRGHPDNSFIHSLSPREITMI